MLLTIGAAIVVLGVLIFVHELGHFWAAKAVGIGVPRFSIGLGPVTPFAFRRGETEYVISWIPFGGYVKMATAEEEDDGAVAALEGGEAEEFPPEKLFENKPLWARILVISAGVIMNAVFAYVVYVGLGVTYGRIEDPTTTIAAVDTTVLPEAAQPMASVPFGARVERVNGDTVHSWNDIRDRLTDPTTPNVRFDFAGDVAPVVLPIDGYAMNDRVDLYFALVPYWEARVASVEPNSAAEEAGFVAGDLIIRANGDTIRAWTEMVSVVQQNGGREVAFDVLRDGEILTLPATPRGEAAVDPATGEPTEIVRLGVARQINTRQVRLSLPAALVDGGRRVGDDASMILFALGGLIRGRLSPRELGGPVLIGQISGQVARQGVVSLLQFMALFSVNLAILNLLPIPVLDGGHLVFLVIEGVRGRPMSMALRLRLSQFGLVILLGIMALALTNDLLRVFGI